MAPPTWRVQGGVVLPTAKGPRDCSPKSPDKRLQNVAQTGNSCPFPTLPSEGEEAWPTAGGKPSPSESCQFLQVWVLVGCMATGQGAVRGGCGCWWVAQPLQVRVTCSESSPQHCPLPPRSGLAVHSWHSCTLLLHTLQCARDLRTSSGGRTLRGSAGAGPGRPCRESTLY